MTDERRIAMLTEGTRVRIKIRPDFRSTYATGYADRLDGNVGIVEERKDISVNGDYLGTRPWYGPAVLVRFDEPIATPWSNGSPCAASWFPPGDVEILGGDS